MDDMVVEVSPWKHERLSLGARLIRWLIDPHPERDESHAGTRYQSCVEECRTVQLLEDRLAVATCKLAEADDRLRLMGDELKKYMPRPAPLTEAEIEAFR